MPSSSYSHMRSPTVDSSSRGGPLGHHDFPSLVGADIQHDTTATMLTIDSLLNPAGGHRYHEQYGNTAPPTPAYSSCTYSQGGTPRPETPLTPSPKRQKLVKDAAMFVRNRPQGEINYPASECSEDYECLAPHQRQELAQQHLNFHLFPSGRGEDGRIEDYARRIPYSSEKKEFLTKTGRDAFEVFQYTFVVPNDPNRKEHVVMWDYRIGLVRITPFFKALQHIKTTPAKALSTNSGLKDLAHSITGGALVAQGYWIPYACARAVCLTFCYNIRWALTPVFGPTFINECLRPGEPGFGSFKIDPEVVRCAAREAEGWRPDNYGQRVVLVPAASHHYGQPAPRSQPEEFRQPVPAPQPRGGHISFHTDSPFGPNAQRSTGPSYTYAGPGNESPALSPKSTSYEYRESPGWTSINRRHDEVYQQPYAGPVEPLADSLLMEPRYAAPVPWRAAEPLRSMPKQRYVEPAQPQAKQALKRRHSDVDDSLDELPDEEPEAVLSTSSESDDTDLPLSPPPTRPSRNSRVTRSSKKSKPATGPSGKKFTDADEQAARWLLNLSTRDSQLAREPNQFSMRNFEMSGQ